jgi:hypothetical protein
MIKVNGAVGAAAVSLLAAMTTSCATRTATGGGPASADVSTTPPPPSLVDGGDISLGALDGAAIPKGECGMVLWTLESERPTAIFRYVAGETAELSVNGSRREFALQQREGASGFGVFERQDFVADKGMKASVSVTFGLGFDGGAYLERGVISVTDANGWKLVTPAAGIAGCRSK